MGREDGASPGSRKPYRKAGFTHAASAAAPMLRGAGAKRGFAEHRLLTEWFQIVGAELGAACRPVSVAYGGRGGGLGATLIVSADGARAVEAQHLADRIVERVNQVYGYRAVTRMRVVQTGAPETGFSEGPESFDRAPPVDLPPSADILRIEDPGLRDALARLEANIRKRGGAPRRAKEQTA
jgi:hypothetical protein